MLVRRCSFFVVSRAGTQGKLSSAARGGIVFRPHNFHAFVVQQQNTALPTRRCGCDSRRALQFQIYGVRQLAQLSLQNSIRLGRHQHAVPVWGHMCRSGETALQAVSGGCNSHCLHQFEPTRVMFRSAVCRTVVSKQGRKTTSGALPPSPTITTRKRNSRLACLSSRR